MNVTTPSFPESVKDGTIRLLKKVGDQVSADETIAEIETDKTNLSVNAPQAGTIEELLVADGDNVTSGASIAKLSPGGADAKSASAKPKKDMPTAETDARKSHDETKKPSGDQQAVTKPAAAPAPEQAAKRETAAPPKPQPSTSAPNHISGTRSETRVKMSRMRLKIAERLKEAQNTCAMLTTFNEIDMR